MRIPVRAQVAENMPSRPPPEPLAPGEYGHDTVPCRTLWRQWAAADEGAAEEAAKDEARPESPTAGPAGAFAMLLSNAYARSDPVPRSFVETVTWKRVMKTLALVKGRSSAAA